MTRIRTSLAATARRLARSLFPSVPYADQARILAAMEGREPMPRPAKEVRP